MIILFFAGPFFVVITDRHLCGKTRGNKLYRIVKTQYIPFNAARFHKLDAKMVTILCKC